MLEHAVYPIFRRVDFRGKGRLRNVLPVRDRGTAIVAFGGGIRLELDLRESLQRDFLFGMVDRRELDVVRRHLQGRDFVDVGAHIGMYTVAAARATTGRVVAFEPNPSAREQLGRNVRLNGCANVEIVAAAVADRHGRARLHVPATPDPSFSSLTVRGFEEGEPVEVPVTTVDAEVERLALRPSVVKIDVEGGEVAVVTGMRRTVAEHRPAVVVEVTEASARALAALLEGYSGFRVGRRLEPLESGRGLFNALFVPQPPV